ncbi:MAG: peptide chain release factor N(5)-glutamine methyltransferase [Pyrinomonadaceae bacterium]
MNEPHRFTVAQAMVEATHLLRTSGVIEARRDAAALLAHVIARDRTFLLTHANDALAASDVMRLREFVERRAQGEPLQYITGHQEFFNLNFEVTNAVLIPRPETELLVERSLQLLVEIDEPAPLVCDVGTGSGCISISLLHERPRLRAVAIDVSTSALCVAARNASRHGVSERLALLASDGLTALDESHARFFMIVSNPPYIAESELPALQREVRDYEPRAALTPGADGLFMIRRLLADSSRFLHANGSLLFEIGYDQHAAVEALIDKSVWTLQAIHKDLQNIPRLVELRRK